MAYRFDTDLLFLEKCKSEDLNDLVYCLTHDNNGSTRLTEELTSSADYKLHYPDHRMYWRDIAAEIQCFGANSFATILRKGKGVLYREVLIDVCSKLKVNFSKNSSVERIEKELLSKILEDALDKMSNDQLNELASSLGVKNTQLFTKQVALASFIKIFQMGGFKSYQLTVIIANTILKTLVGRGLTFAGNAALTRTAAVLTGPIGWALTGAWTAVDLAGPAYRVTIPAVIQIAVLRQKLLYEENVNVDELEFK